MAKKKDFSEMQTGKVYTTLERATGKNGQQATATEEEAAARQEALETQGRKGCRAIRINMAFTPSNHEFLKIMAGATGKSLTGVCNAILAQYRAEHPELMAKAKEFIDVINSGVFSKLPEGAGEEADEQE